MQTSEAERVQLFNAKIKIEWAYGIVRQARVDGRMQQSNGVNQIQKEQARESKVWFIRPKVHRRWAGKSRLPQSR